MFLAGFESFPYFSGRVLRLGEEGGTPRSAFGSFRRSPVSRPFTVEVVPLEISTFI
jgi:hypothetical protein